MTFRSDPCERCNGTGEIITNWERYVHPLPGDKGDEAVADCPDCDGRGHFDITEDGEPLEELTPEGVQLVIPGTEKRLPATAKQGELW